MYKIDEIAKITKEPTTKQKTVAVEEAEKPLFPAKGYMNITEVQVGSVLGAIRDVSVGLHTIHGYQFNPHIGLGAGIGFHYYNGASNIPLFLDFRYTFRDAKVSPFLGVQSGINAGNIINRSTSVGTYNSLAFGLKVRTSDSFVFHTALSGDFSTIYGYSLFALVLRLGASF